MQQQQQQQQQGGSQFGQPPSEMADPFSPQAHLMGGASGADHLQLPQPMPESAAQQSAAVNFDELAPAVAGNFPDDDSLVAGEDPESGGLGGSGAAASGNRWPRQETLALLKIRSEMDATFRDATLKAPLWNEVSRKLAELGYKRSAKKCKEKFENVHKYYKRTKDGRAGRQDGKSYRFFRQLEALHSDGGSASHAPSAPPAVVPVSTAFMVGGPPPNRAQPISSVAPPTLAMPTRAVVPELTTTPHGATHGFPSSSTAGFSFSSNSSASSSSDSDDEVTEEAGGRREGRKRKRGGGGSTTRKMMAFFDRLTRQVMERQEAMQQRFLEAIEKREQDRMIRDEAWRRQEMARLSRDQELLAQERAMTASRDNAIISYLQKISGQTIPIPATAASPISVAPAANLHHHQQQPSRSPAPPPPPQPPPATLAQPSPRQQHQPSVAAIVPDLEATQEPTLSSSSSRWPKAEVDALIKIRSDLETKFYEAGPKGPLWEEISAGMHRLGYSRSSKRCKEKWENINKYFKKVKESNKKRPDDSKTCPYYHQLEALYRRKLLGPGSGGGSSSSTAGIQQQQPPPPQPEQQPGREAERNSPNNGNSDSGGSAQMQTSNGLPPSFFEMGLKKPEDIVNELMAEPDQAVMDDDDDDAAADSDNVEDDDDDEDDEAGKLQYKIQFQMPQNASGGGGGNATAPTTTTAGSFLAMA